ncbi:ATP synthase subunit b [Geodia barretti]|uniref:ATP synthase subunit b n=2 Tax=Geodia barretti TaxID=519541 RepID=A0AA35WYC3_GEOBA|nr:ATP synthase subunit b [Geodia barretti]
MNINLTLIGQTVTFIIFVWFCMKFIWPPIMNALNERRKTISDGLAAAEQGQREREKGQMDANELVEEAKSQAQEIISRAEKRGTEVVADAKSEARTEGERILNAARGEIEMEANRTREQLRVQVAQLAVSGAEKILAKEVDAKTHEKMLSDLADNL